MNLYEEIEKIKASGYSEQNAQSKLGQDIVLKAIADSGMAQNATIKGGVVMRSISSNAGVLLRISILILSDIPSPMIPFADLWKSWTASTGWA